MYNKRTFLNGPKSPYTGSIVCFSGKTKLGNDKEQLHTFLEVADCRGKVWLHRDSNVSKKKFIKKIRKLIKELQAFVEYLEEQ